MATPTKKTPKPAAPSAADAAPAAGNQPSQVGAGKQPDVDSPSASGSATNASESQPDDRVAGNVSAVDSADEDGPTGGEPPVGAGCDVRVHPAAVDAGLPNDVVHYVCGQLREITDVLGARRYGATWVLVVQSARKAWKLEVSP